MQDVPTKANVGFQLWNMSKRLSGIKGDARRAGVELERALGARDLEPRERATLVKLRSRFGRCEALADETWARLASTATQIDPGLVDETDDVTVVRNHGSNPTLLDELWSIWHDSEVFSESAALAAELANHLARHSGDRPPAEPGDRRIHGGDLGGITGRPT